MTDCFHKCLDHALAALKQRPVANHLGGNIITGLRSGALLICGSGAGAGVGCGKTALAHAVCHQLNQWPVCAHITHSVLWTVFHSEVCVNHFYE